METNPSDPDSPRSSVRIYTGEGHREVLGDEGVVEDEIFLLWLYPSSPHWSLTTGSELS